MSFDDDVAQELSADASKDGNVSEEADSRFQLLTKLISTPETLSEDEESFRKLEKLIRSDFLKLCSGIGIPGECALYNELLLTLSDLRELIEFPYLANKNILAVGGGFSAGKSRFLNSIVGEDLLLPEGIQPTTAIPTYLISGKDEEISALNTFNRTQPLNRAMLGSIAHAFNEGKKAKSGTISFYHILKLIQVKVKKFKWDNIALLDTPGYSKPHTDTGDVNQKGSDAGNTDAEKAREHLSLADHLIWVVSAPDGTMQQPDIDFLKDQVKWERPLYILINKADQKNKDDIRAIFKQVKEDAEDAGFTLAGLSAYDSRNKKVVLGDDPKKWFDEINKKCKYTQWHGRFKAIFEKIIQFNAEEEARCRTLKVSLDPIYLKGDDILSSEQISKLKETMKAISDESKAHAAAAKQFTLFSEKAERLLDDILKQIGVTDETASAVGIAGRWIAPNGSLPQLKKGEVIKGTVDSLSKFRGCFVSSPALKDQIRIRYSDIAARYTDPAKVFGEKKPVLLTVYDIDRAESAIVFTVTPEKGK